MKKITAFFFILCSLCLFSNCDKQDDVNTDCSEDNKMNFNDKFDSEVGRTIAKVFNNKSIGFDSNGDPFVCNGAGWVFYYDHVGPDNPMIADEEITQRFLFEISAPPLTDNVLIKDAALETANAHYFLSCFCPEIGYFPTNAGTIEAKQQVNGDWEVTIDVEFGNQYPSNYQHTIIFEEEF